MFNITPTAENLRWIVAQSPVRPVRWSVPDLQRPAGPAEHCSDGDSQAEVENSTDAGVQNKSISIIRQNL